MNDDDRSYLVSRAIEAAFIKQVSKQFGVLVSSSDLDAGLDLFMEGFKKAVAALDAIEKELER